MWVEFRGSLRLGSDDWVWETHAIPQLGAGVGLELGHPPGLLLLRELLLEEELLLEVLLLLDGLEFHDFHLKSLGVAHGSVALCGEEGGNLGLGLEEHEFLVLLVGLVQEEREVLVGDGVVAVHVVEGVVRWGEGARG